MTKKTIKQLQDVNPIFLNIFWCDRCNNSINTNENKDHFHEEQCGCCKKYRQVDPDWGYCSHHDSVYSGRKMFEHDTCSKWVEGKW